MLKTDAPSLMEEVRSSEKFMDNRRRTAREEVERYAGRRHNIAAERPTSLENHAFEYISLVVPQYIFENPTVLIKNKRLNRPDIQDIVDSVTPEMNQWIRDTDCREEFLLSAVDDAFGNGPLLTKQEPEPGFDYSEPDVPHRPRIYRLSPEQFGYDSRTTQFKRARFVYHSIIRDKDDIMREAMMNPEKGWILPNIVALQTAEFPRASFGNFMNAARDRRELTVLTPRRDEVRIFEVWVPEATLDIAEAAGGTRAGFHGTIFTIGESGDAGIFVRSPRPYFGPSWGPYAYEGNYVVPDDPEPLAPLTATSSQAREFDDVAKALSRGTRSYKKLVLVSSENPALGEIIATKPHLFVVPVEGLDKDAWVEVEIGGITEQQIKQAAIMKDRLDRNSGISETRRGNITGASATEVEEAGAAGDARMAYIARQFQGKVRRALKTALWYFLMDSRVSTEDGFQGGLPPGTTPEAIDLTLEPGTMGRESVAVRQQKGLVLMQLIAQLAQLAAVPGIDIVFIAKLLGQWFELPELPKAFDGQALQAYSLIQAIAGSGAKPEGSRAGRPQRQNPQRGTTSRAPKGKTKSGPQRTAAVRRKRAGR